MHLNGLFFLSERNVLCDAKAPRTVWEHLLQLAAINQSVKWNPVMTAVKNIAPIVIKPIYISQDFSNCSRNGTHRGMFTLSVLYRRRKTGQYPGGKLLLIKGDTDTSV